MTLSGRLAWDLLEPRRRRGEMTPAPVESMAVTRGRAEDQSTANEALRTLVGLGGPGVRRHAVAPTSWLGGARLSALPERPPVKAQPLVPVAAGGRLLVDALGSEEAIVAACASAFDATETTGEVGAR